jgi:predicted AlkP superfamily pyrophosphatase or phosphodiesterase
VRLVSGELILVLIRLFVAIIVAAWQSTTAGAADAKPKYILFVTSDGFRSDYIEWYSPTNLQWLIARGARVRHATNVFPTVTTPNMTSLVTGAYPRTTGVACNSQYEKERNEIVGHIRENKGETISETLHRAGWKTGAVNHFMLADRTDRYVSAPYDDSEKTTDAILDLLEKKQATFVAAIYGAPDHAGHNHGPKSPEVREAVHSVDAAVGRLIERLKQVGIFNETLITFNADHGMSAYEQKQASAEPATVLREAGFKVARSQSELKADTEIVVLSYGVRLIYFRKPLSTAQRQKVVNVLESINGVEVLDRERLNELGCHSNRSGDLIVNPLPGYTMSGAGKGGGQHGRFAENNPVLFFEGPGIKRGVTIQSARTVDIVPTLLKVAGVKPANTVDGRVIEEALDSEY